MKVKPLKNNIFTSHPIIVISLAQLFGTSLWFSANSAALDLMKQWQITIKDIGWLTNAVQAGFIVGTFLIAYTGMADRFKARSIFISSAIFGALFNLCFAWIAHGLLDAILYRFLVGLCLAGIYPIGMKLIITWVPDQAGQALAILVAMLTLGTALPYFINSISTNLPWQTVMVCSSTLALIAAFLIYQLQSANISTELKNTKTSNKVFQAFKIGKFRAAAVGYFGHMWELYAFWTVIPLFINKAGISKKLGYSNTSLITFLVIASGALGCLLGGYLSKKYGNRNIAIGALLLSGLSCLVFVAGWRFLPENLLLIVLIIWGISVIADSPQFSALSAKSCNADNIGVALAIQNSIGFAITIISITFTTYAFEVIGLDAAWILFIGPVVGICGYFITDKTKKTTTT